MELRTEERHSPWPATRPLAFVGVTVFVSGFFLLATLRRDLPSGSYALIFAAAVLLALPLAGLTWIVAWSEAATGRAWAGGLRRLDRFEQSPGGTTLRALRYAGVLWLANGGALWVAALAGPA